MIPLKQTTSLTIALLLSLSSSFPGQAQSGPTVLPNANDSIDPIIFNSPPEPPSTGQPGRRSDAGSRGCGGDESSSSSESMSSESLPLLALVPIQATVGSEVVFGKTAAEHPTFWFYVPQGDDSLTATFVLQDRDGNPIYESEVALPPTAGILSLTLPPTVALETGKPYHWFFKLYCRSISPPSFVEGWIQREALPSDLTVPLETATLQQQVRLYAAHGFWFEALTLAAQLRQTHSSDSAWAELLGAIGLEQIATEAIATP